tara:strand:- start:13 stop:594 length:582 start_codon:yes stop_codon:yes gene_type:complete
MSVTTIGVIGAGQMGLGIAQAFASAGFQVILNDIDAAAIDRGLQSINTSLTRLHAKGSLREQPQAVFARIKASTELAVMIASKNGSAIHLTKQLVQRGQDLESFPLNRGGRLARYIVSNPRYPGDLIDDPTRHRFQQLIGEMRPTGRHEIDRFYGSQRYHVFVAAAIADNTHRLDRQKHHKRLTGLVIPARAV